MSKGENYFLTIHEIIRTGHWITDQVNVLLKSDGISEPQYNVLKVLDNADGKPVTVQEIQEQMVQRSSNVTRIIDKLLLKDLVDRKECSENRRKMDITITREGQNLLKKLDRKVVKFHLPMSKNITSEEAVMLKRLIKKLKGE